MLGRQEPALSPGAEVSRARTADATPPRASIIIRTRNEAEALADTLTGVFTQSLPPHEVIVMDSGSTDATLDIARTFPVTVMEIAPKLWNYSRAINQAAASSTGDILVCLSAHCRPVTDEWLASLCRHFADPIVAGVWGPGLNPHRDAPATGTPQRQLPGTYTVETRMWGLSNANSAIRRSLWAHLPFDETMPATEDKAWGLAMLDRGYVIVHDPEAGVWHENHTVVNGYHRNLAVQAGFRQIFPELEAPFSSQIGVVLRRARMNLATRARARDAAGLWRDITRLPGVLAALAGGIVGVRSGVLHRKRWSALRHPSAHRIHRHRHASITPPVTEAGAPEEPVVIERIGDQGPAGALARPWADHRQQGADVQAPERIG